MRIDVVSIFPEYLQPIRQSLPGKAIESGIVDFAVHDLRSWTHDVHHSVDDSPYGGGPGMVMKAPVWGEALDEICTAETLLVVPTPAARLFTQADAQRWTAEEHLVFACGRYEGIDQRVADDAATRMRVEEVSIGDYVLRRTKDQVLRDLPPKLIHDEPLDLTPEQRERFAELAKERRQRARRGRGRGAGDDRGGGAPVARSSRQSNFPPG